MQPRTQHTASTHKRRPEQQEIGGRKGHRGNKRKEAAQSRGETFRTAAPTHVLRQAAHGFLPRFPLPLGPTHSRRRRPQPPPPSCHPRPATFSEAQVRAERSNTRLLPSCASDSHITPVTSMAPAHQQQQQQKTRRQIALAHAPESPRRPPPKTRPTCTPHASHRSAARPLFSPHRARPLC